MVSPLSTKPRGLSKAAALVAVACVGMGYSFGSASASPAVDTNCRYSVSEGDEAHGIQLVGDAACAAGGIGCFKNACRYCKVKDTPQSTHMVTCASLGYPKTAAPTTTAPLPPAPAPFGPIAGTVDLGDGETNCPFPVSEGDFAAGIQLVGDATCAKGGLGCYANVCRFCKFRVTPKSRHMLTCASLGYPQFGNPGEGPSDVGTANGCPFDVSEGDAAVGMNLVGDASCATGGVGCFEGVCRYCKLKETPQSSHLLSCADVDSSQTWNPADITDPPVSPAPSVTAKPPVVPTTAPPPAVPTTAPPPPVTTAPPPPVTTAATPPPTTKAPVTPAPVPTTTTTNCAFSVSSGDLAVGIQLVGDATCASGGVGCFENVCRYCKVKATPQSAHLVTCASLGYKFGSGTPVVPGPAPTPAPVTTQAPSPATTSAPAPVVTAAPTQAPTSAPVVTAAPGPASGCPYSVSDGDFAAGIKLVGDASCAAGGLGCFKDVCRYCKFKETAQSAHWAKCSDYAGVADAPQPPPVVAPAPTTGAYTTAPIMVVDPLPPSDYSPPVPLSGGVATGATAVAPTQCAETASSSDVELGIDVVTDLSCAASGSAPAGCVKGSVCRYCARWPSPDSEGLAPCDSSATLLPAIRAAATSPVARASVDHKLDEMLNDKTFKWSATAAACVGVVAAVALVTLSTKRALARRGRGLLRNDSTDSDTASAVGTVPAPAKPPTPVFVDCTQEGSV